MAIDSLLRLAEANRLLPMRLVALRTNAVVLARLQKLLSLAYMNARLIGMIDKAFEASLDHERIDPRLAPIFDQMSLRRSYGDEPFGHRLALAAEGVREMADEALDKYGSYQEPDIAAAVAAVRNLGVVIIALHLKGDASGVAMFIAEEEWLEAIRAHNRLADILEREAAKHYRELRIDVSLDRFFARSERIPYRKLPSTD